MTVPRQLAAGFILAVLAVGVVFGVSLIVALFHTPTKHWTVDQAARARLEHAVAISINGLNEITSLPNTKPAPLARLSDCEYDESDEVIAQPGVIRTWTMTTRDPKLARRTALVLANDLLSRGWVGPTPAHGALAMRYPGRPENKIFIDAYDGRVTATVAQPDIRVCLPR